MPTVTVIAKTNPSVGYIGPTESISLRRRSTRVKGGRVIKTVFHLNSSRAITEIPCICGPRFKVEDTEGVYFDKNKIRANKVVLLTSVYPSTPEFHSGPKVPHIDPSLLGANGLE